MANGKGEKERSSVLRTLVPTTAEDVGVDVSMDPNKPGVIHITIDPKATEAFVRKLEPSEVDTPAGRPMVEVHEPARARRFTTFLRWLANSETSPST